MQSYISVKLESSGRISSGHRHHRGGLDQSPRERFKYWLRKLITVLFSQVGVGSLLVLYTIFGAMLFISIESVVDSRRLSQVASLRSSTVIQLWNVTQNYNVIYGNEWRKEVDQIVRHFQDGLVREIRLGYEGIDAKEPWTFPQALMFSLSVYTTIGYGNLTPKTDWGKATTCLYAVVGIPLLLLYMANVGDLLATSFQQFYRSLNRCKKKINKMRDSSRQRKLQFPNIGKGDSLARTFVTPGQLSVLTLAHNCHGKINTTCKSSVQGQHGIPDDNKQCDTCSQSTSVPVPPTFVSPKESETSYYNDNDFEENEATIPISTCLSVFFCYILLGSVLFSWWEGWEYFEGSYFCFVSLVTIGFSDMVPGQRRTRSSVFSLTSEPVSVSHVVANSEEIGDGQTTGVKMTADTSAPGSNDYEESLDHVDGQLILCSIYILFGMALMAMCFHLTQERFFATAKKFGKALHLI